MLKIKDMTPSSNTFTKFPAKMKCSSDDASIEVAVTILHVLLLSCVNSSVIEN